MTNKKNHGYTLIELLISISIMAGIGISSWMGIDSFIKIKEGLSNYNRRTSEIQIAVNQLEVDIDKRVEVSKFEPISWNGKILTIVRRSLNSDEGVQVVAWGIQQDQNGKFLNRWVSNPVKSYENLRKSYLAKEDWNDKINEGYLSAVINAENMQVFFWSANGWSDSYSEDVSNSQKENNLNNSIYQGLRFKLDLSSGSLIKDFIF